MATMTKDEITEKVTKVIVDKLGVNSNEIIPSANFVNDLRADSLDNVELIMEFENEFNFKIPDEEAEKLTTVGEVIEYIIKNVK
jgi:acyl carrier protein